MRNLSPVLEVLTQHNHLSTTLIQQNTYVYLFLSPSNVGRLEQTFMLQRSPQKSAATHECL